MSDCRILLDEVFSCGCTAKGHEKEGTRVLVFRPCRDNCSIYGTFVEMVKEEGHQINIKKGS